MHSTKRIPFDAIFGASDLIAIGAIKALEEAEVWRKCQAMLRLWVLMIFPWPFTPAHRFQPCSKTLAWRGIIFAESLLKKVNGEPVESMLLPAKLIVRSSRGAKAAKLN